MKNKELLPFSALVLYAKGWIRFPWIKYNNKNCEDYAYRELRTILRLCDYYPTTDNDVLYLLLNAVDTIVKVYKEHNFKYPYEFDSFYSMIMGAKDYQYNYNIKTFELALCRFVISRLMMLDINNFYITYIDYCKYKLKNINCIESTTYTTCQKRFNTVFKDLICSPKSISKYTYDLKTVK